MSLNAGPGGVRRPTSVRAVYRSWGGENAKGRPDWYGKTLGLLSFVRAVEKVGAAAEVVFVNDGPVPAPRSEVMARVGEVVSIAGGSNRRSYRAALAREARRTGDPDTVVWFAEDDYLYRPDTFETLLAGAAAMPWADYFTLHGWECLDTGAPRRRPRPRPLPGAAAEPSPVPAGGVTWYRALSTSSTFGVRRGVLRDDRRLLRTVPFTGGAWDMTTCLIYQGLAPFPVRALLDGVLGRDPETTALRGAVRATSRAAVSVRALRRPSRRRMLVGSDPELVAHMELPEPSPRTPPPAVTSALWGPDLAAETWRWGRERGLVADGSELGGTR